MTVYKVRTMILYNNARLHLYKILHTASKSKKLSFSCKTVYSQCVGNRSHHLMRYHACSLSVSLSLSKFPSLLRPSESSLPFAPFVLGATIGRQMTATTTMRGAATRGMKIAAREGWGKGRLGRIKQENEREKVRGRKSEDDGEKGDERKGTRKTGDVWREQRGVARWMIARRGSIDLGNCTLSQRSLYLSLFLLSLFLFLLESSLLRIYGYISPRLPRSPLFRPCFVRSISSSLSRGFAPLYRGLGATAVGFRVMRAPIFLFLLLSRSLLYLYLFSSVRPSFLPPARERSSPSGSKPKNLRRTLLSPRYIQTAYRRPVPWPSKSTTSSFGSVIHSLSLNVLTSAK